MNGRIKVKITYHPVNYLGIFLWTMLFLMTPVFFISMLADSGAMLISCLAITLIAAVTAGVLSIAKALVYADSERICRRYMKKDSVIMLSEIEEISYSVYTEYHGRYSSERLMLTLKTRDGEVHSLNDDLSTESFAAALDPNWKTAIPLIQLYRFLAELMPEKAKGYTEPEEKTLYF